MVLSVTQCPEHSGLSGCHCPCAAWGEASSARPAFMEPCRDQAASGARTALQERCSRGHGGGQKDSAVGGTDPKGAHRTLAMDSCRAFSPLPPGPAPAAINVGP